MGQSKRPFQSAQNNFRTLDLHLYHLSEIQGGSNINEKTGCFRRSENQKEPPQLRLLKKTSHPLEGNQVHNNRDTHLFLKDDSFNKGAQTCGS